MALLRFSPCLRVCQCGDLNSIPTGLVINLLLSHGRLSDSWSVAHPPGSDSVSTTSVPPTAQEAITFNGITCDNPLNSWSAKKRFGEDIVRSKGKRLDYVLFRRPDRWKNEGKHHLQCHESSVTAVEMCPGTDYSLSDHFGVEALFSFSPIASSESPAGSTTVPHKEELIPSRPQSREVLGLSLAAITIYASHSSSFAQFQLTLFGASLFGIPVLAVAASFQPVKWLNWIFVLLGVANGVGGATMLYTGFVGGRWEMSALKNVIKDMSCELERLGRV